MGSFEGWGAIAAALLVAECIVFNLVFVALAAGLWQGSAWLHRNAHTGLMKLAEWLGIGQKYAQKGQAFLVSPFVRLQGHVEGIRTAWQRLKG
jgi:hypothetical protein